jgi:hypothetical protein
MSGFGSANHQKAIERIKAENDGVLPSDLYLQTNEELSKLLFDLTGKFPPPRTSKKVLVARIERYTDASSEATITKKRKVEPDAQEDASLTKAVAMPKKTKRGCLAALTAGQISEMKRILLSANADNFTHRELEPMWARMGVIARYPVRYSKSNIISKMQEFARRNLEFHELM